MGDLYQAKKSSEIQIDADQVYDFHYEYDPNPEHTTAAKFLPSDSVSGIYLLSLINRWLVESEEFKFRCGTNLNVKFLRPILIHEKLSLTGYQLGGKIDVVVYGPDGVQRMKYQLETV